METVALRRRRRGGGFSSYERLFAIIFTIVAVFSPLYIDRRTAQDEEEDDEVLSMATVLPLLLIVLILAIVLSCYLDQNFTRFDPYWIHRVWGSSGGIILVLTILVLVLKCKS